MKKAHTVLLAALVAGLCWQAAASAASNGFFGVRTRVEPNYFVLEMRLPVLCLRLQADVSGIIVATAHLPTCEGCLEAPRARSWS